MPTEISRRNLLIAIPAIAALSACVRPAKLLGGGVWGQFAPEPGRVIDHSAWDSFLARYVKPSADGINKVAYEEAAANDPATLRPYLNMLQAVDPSSLSKDEQMAFWINLYNALTVDLILQEPDVKSIRNLGVLTTGPWGKKIASVNGTELSLNDIEHGILRPIWNDVRIHYAVNCASIGCPNLALQSYRADRLETMLKKATSDFINHPRAFSKDGDKLQASSIFKWYKEDWGSVQAILDHARKYAGGETAALLAAASKIDGYEYDWDLNRI